MGASRDDDQPNLKLLMQKREPSGKVFLRCKPHMQEIRGLVIVAAYHASSTILIQLTLGIDSPQQLMPGAEVAQTVRQFRCQ